MSYFSDFFSCLHILSASTIVSEEKMGGIEEKITRVLFCGQQFVDSYRYTKEYLSEHPYIQVKIIFGDFSALVKTKSICLFHYCA